jgi:hypothetical protein
MDASDPDAGPDYRSTQLADALQTGDTAAVALALRTQEVVVPLLDAPGHDQVRVFRREDASTYMLLLFSSAEAYAALAPDETGQRMTMYDRRHLLDFLTQNASVLDAVIFDLAGPHPMQAEPAEIIAALELAT